MRTAFIQTFITGLFFLASCSFEKENSKESENDILDISELQMTENEFSPLERINKRDTFKISFQGTDCGEWGGRRESIFLIRNEKYKITARFLQDSVPCEVIEKDGAGILDDSKRVIIVDTTKVLEIEDERLISNFIQRITELYLKETCLANAGNYYSIENTNKTFKLFYWNSGNAMHTGYYEMKSNIFGIDKNHKTPAANRIARPVSKH